ncbi:MAG: MerR family transcriptional regulator [Betaproteobacteria bacterium]|jgi:DNA-binding transcriptional MerR regulator
MEKPLPAIPAKRYFTIGEVSDLCGVKPYVLRYWEQEFTQLKPMKRRGNRRYYQHHEVLLIRRIRELLYDQGFTISGARNRLADVALTPLPGAALPDPDGLDDEAVPPGASIIEGAAAMLLMHPAADRSSLPLSATPQAAVPAQGLTEADARALRSELLSIRELLSP